MYIRFADVNDAEGLIELTQQVEQSNFMLFEPGERQTHPDQLIKRIESMSAEKTSAILLAENDGNLVAYLYAIGGNPKRAAHSVSLVIGVHENERGKGVGSKLFEKAEEWAKKNDIHRLALTVMVSNKAGIALYEKMGFVKEGVKRESLFIDGEYVDEYYMAKLL